MCVTWKSVWTVSGRCRGKSEGRWEWWGVTEETISARWSKHSSRWSVVAVVVLWLGRGAVPVTILGWGNYQLLMGKLLFITTKVTDLKRASEHFEQDQRKLWIKILPVEHSRLSVSGTCCTCAGFSPPHWSSRLLSTIGEQSLTTRGSVRK